MVPKKIFKTVFSGLKKITPYFFYNFVRWLVKVPAGPLYYAFRTGYFRSCVVRKSVSRSGAPIPWYTYPAVDFLFSRSFSGLRVLEFGAGNSTLWWATRAERVVSFEGSLEWYSIINSKMPSNVDLFNVNNSNLEGEVLECLAGLGIVEGFFDVVIVDGLDRRVGFRIADKYVKQDGIIICDNSDTALHGFRDGFLASKLPLRVDFWGNSSGGPFPHCTSILFHATSRLMSADASIPGLEGEVNYL